MSLTISHCTWRLPKWNNLKSATFSFRSGTIWSKQDIWSKDTFCVSFYHLAVLDSVLQYENSSFSTKKSIAEWQPALLTHIERASTASTISTQAVIKPLMLLLILPLNSSNWAVLLTFYYPASSSFFLLFLSLATMVSCEFECD